MQIDEKAQSRPRRDKHFEKRHYRLVSKVVTKGQVGPDGKARPNEKAEHT